MDFNNNGEVVDLSDGQDSSIKFDEFFDFEALSVIPPSSTHGTSNIDTGPAIPVDPVTDSAYKHPIPSAQDGNSKTLLEFAIGQNFDDNSGVEQPAEDPVLAGVDSSIPDIRETGSSTRTQRLLGIPPEYHSQSTEKENLEKGMQYLIANYAALLNNTERQSPGIFEQFGLELRAWIDFVEKSGRKKDAHAQYDESRSLMSYQSGGTRDQDAKGPSPVLYRCKYPGCQHPNHVNRNTFLRHLEKHYASAIYRCPYENCPKDFRRKDNWKGHITTCHRGSEHDFELLGEQCVTRYNSPQTCALCNRIVSDWKDFYKCYTNHCQSRENGSKDSPAFPSGNKGGKDMDDSSDGNSDHSPGKPGKTPSFRSKKSRNGSLGQGQGQSTKRRRKSSNEYSRASQAHSYTSEPSDAMMPPPQMQPGRGQAESSRHAQGRPHRLPSDPSLFPSQLALQGRVTMNARCRTCNHSFSDCAPCSSKMESEDFCHNCPGQYMPMAAPGQVSPTMTRSTRYQAGQRYAAQPQPPSHGYGNPAQYQSFRYDPFNSQNSHTGSLESGGGPGSYYDSFNGSTGDVFDTLAVLDVPVPVEDDFSQALSISKLSQVGFLSKDLPLRPMGPVYSRKFSRINSESEANSEVSEPPKKPSLQPWISDLSTMSTEAIQPANYFGPINGCQCDCNLKYGALRRAMVNMASGMWLEMQLKLVPGEQSPDNLHSRIEVVVNIYGHNSKTQPSGSRQFKAIKAVGHSIEKRLERTEDDSTDTESEDEAIFSDTPASMESSISDISDFGGDVFDEPKKTEMVSYEADLQSFTANLAHWTNSEISDVDFFAPNSEDYDQVSDFYLRRLFWLIYISTRESSNHGSSGVSPEPELD